MLPNRFSLTKKAEDSLKRDKVRTGINYNIIARELFFKSIEYGALPDDDLEFQGGNMILDKSVWLGELEAITDASLKYLYGDVEPNQAAKKWALHVQHGMHL